MRGKFITLEGQDGAGKSTNLAIIEQQLRHLGIELVVTREPGGTPFGEKLRDFILSSQDQQFGDMAELLMIFAARAQHISTVIEPALARGQWVLCDRFTDATYAYQGGGRGIDSAKIAQLEQLVQGDLRPDLTVLLDLSVTTSEQRAGQRSAPDRFERQQRLFKDKVRSCYLERAKNEPSRFTVIDASADLETVKSRAADAITQYVTVVESNANVAH